MIRLAYPDLEFEEVGPQLKKVIDSGWLTKGPKIREFERTIAGYLGTRYAIAVNSGTAALQLALLSLDIGAGDEVIVPDFTFPATANAVELCGAKAVLADIKLDDFNIDPTEIEKKATRRARAIIPVHQFGHPADMDEIMKVAKRHKLYVIEDAACALGAKYKERMCGTIGNLGCFSFHPRKIVTTGEGGAIVTDNSRLARRLRMLREHGMKQTEKTRRFFSIGFNCRMSEISSVLGLAQLKKIESIVKERNKLAETFKKIVIQTPTVTVIPDLLDKRSRSTYQSFIVKIGKEVDILKLIGFLRRKGIEAAISNVVLHIQPYYQRKYAFKKGDFKNSLYAFQKSLALPFHCRMNRKDFIKIAAALREYIGDR